MTQGMDHYWVCLLFFLPREHFDLHTVQNMGYPLLALDIFVQGVCEEGGVNLFSDKPFSFLYFC